MTIDEAIKYAETLATNQRIFATKVDDESRKNYKQVAEWLKDYKKYLTTTEKRK